MNILSNRIRVAKLRVVLWCQKLDWKLYAIPYVTSSYTTYKYVTSSYTAYKYVTSSYTTYKYVTSTYTTYKYRSYYTSKFFFSSNCRFIQESYKLELNWLWYLEIYQIIIRKLNTNTKDTALKSSCSKGERFPEVVSSRRSQ